MNKISIISSPVKNKFQTPNKLAKLPKAQKDELRPYFQISCTLELLPLIYTSVPGRLVPNVFYTNYTKNLINGVDKVPELSFR